MSSHPLTFPDLWGGGVAPPPPAFGILYSETLFRNSQVFPSGCLVTHSWHLISSSFVCNEVSFLLCFVFGFFFMNYCRTSFSSSPPLLSRRSSKSELNVREFPHYFSALWQESIDGRQEGSLQNTRTATDPPAKAPQLESPLSSSNGCGVLSKQQPQEIRIPDCVLMIPPEEQKQHEIKPHNEEVVSSRGSGYN